MEKYISRKQLLRDTWSFVIVIPIGNKEVCFLASWKCTMVSISLFFQLSDMQILKQKQKIKLFNVSTYNFQLQIRILSSKIKKASYCFWFFKDTPSVFSLPEQRYSGSLFCFFLLQKCGTLSLQWDAALQFPTVFSFFCHLACSMPSTASLNPGVRILWEYL